MTFRAKPVVKRAQKPSWESRDRKNFYLNLGFGLVVAAAVLILAVAVALTYYNDHLASVGSVAGQSISKDELRDRVLIEQWRLSTGAEPDRHRRRPPAGCPRHRPSSRRSSSNSKPSSWPRSRWSASSTAASRRTWRPPRASPSTEADVDARLLKEATTPETRHAWVIEVAPEIDADATEPTAAQIAAARTKIDTALRDVGGSKTWEDVAKTVSTDASTAAQGGDLGWIQAESSQEDEAFSDALFAAEIDTPTAVIEGEDGILRIGRVTEIDAETVDDLYTDKLVNDGVELAKYRTVVRSRRDPREARGKGRRGRHEARSPT